MKRFNLFLSIWVGLCLLIGALLLLPTGNIEPAQAAVPVLAGEDGTRDTITPTNLSASGVAQTLSAASGDGHKFSNTNRDILVVTNDYTDTVTLTIVTGGQVGGLDIDDIDISLTAGQTKMAGPFETTIFNQTSGSDAGKIYINFDAAVTGTVANSVTLSVFRTP